MSLSDPIADFLTRLRNAQSAFMSEVRVPFSKMNRAMLSILKSEGYILDFVESSSSGDVDATNCATRLFVVILKYYSRAPVITRIFRVSKSGKRVYSSACDIPKLCNGLGIYVISTSRGVLSDHQARKLGVGGEILCGVF